MSHYPATGGGSRLAGATERHPVIRTPGVLPSFVESDGAERLIAKARRRGKVGWNVGQHERMLHVTSPVQLLYGGKTQAELD